MKKLNEIKERFNKVPPLSIEDCLVYRTDTPVKRTAYACLSQDTKEDDETFREFIGNIQGDMAYLIEALDRAIEKFGEKNGTNNG